MDRKPRTRQQKKPKTRSAKKRSAASGKPGSKRAARGKKALRAVRESTPVHEIQREEKGHFVPGRSANPGGRPKLDSEIRALAQSYGAKAIHTLGRLLEHKSPRARVLAAEALLNRGFGRPAQAVELSFRREDIAARIAGLSAEEKRQVAAGDLRPLMGKL